MKLLPFKNISLERHRKVEPRPNPPLSKSQKIINAKKCASFRLKKLVGEEYAHFLFDTYCNVKRHITDKCHTKS